MAGFEPAVLGVRSSMLTTSPLVHESMVGFEPTVCFRIRVLQTRSLNHSDTCSVAEVGFEPTRAFRPSGF